MALPPGISRSIIIIGVIMLLFGGGGVACGVMAKKILTGPIGATIGLWAGYFIALGLIFIVIGILRQSTCLCLVVLFQIIGLAVAAVGIVISALFAVFLETCSGNLVVGFPVNVLTNHCACGIIGDVTNYDVSCDNLRKLRNITVAASIIYGVLEITSIFAVIYGCVGMCCSREEPRTVAVRNEARPMRMTGLSSKGKKR